MHVYDHKATKEKRAIVTFTFDGAMTLPVFDTKLVQWVRSTEPNPYILEEMFRLACEQWKIVVIADRPKTLGDKADVNGFIKKHELPISGTIFTCGTKIVDCIERAESILHFDHDLAVIARLPHGVTGIKVPHPKRESSGPLLSFLSATLLS